MCRWCGFVAKNKIELNREEILLLSEQRVDNLHECNGIYDLHINFRTESHQFRPNLERIRHIFTPVCECVFMFVMLLDWFRSHHDLLLWIGVIWICIKWVMFFVMFHSSKNKTREREWAQCMYNLPIYTQNECACVRVCEGQHHHYYLWLKFMICKWIMWLWSITHIFDEFEFGKQETRCVCVKCHVSVFFFLVKVSCMFLWREIKCVEKSVLNLCAWLICACNRVGYIKTCTNQQSCWREIWRDFSVR